MRVPSLAQEDPPEKEMATHPSILAWKILWTKEPGGLESMGLQRTRLSLQARRARRRVALGPAETGRAPGRVPAKHFFFKKGGEGLGSVISSCPVL